MAAAHGTPTSKRCSWCGGTVEPGDGFWATEHPGERHAVFCRLEHIVPWAIQGAKWHAGGGESAERVDSCAHCGAELGDVHVQLVRHRGDHRIRDAFCSADHMAAWAKDGGRWR
jgi:hypothetical protein